jgi:hypothetical protein
MPKMSNFRSVSSLDGHCAGSMQRPYAPEPKDIRTRFAELTTREMRQSPLRPAQVNEWPIEDTTCCLLPFEGLGPGHGLDGCLCWPSAPSRTSRALKEVKTGTRHVASKWIADGHLTMMNGWRVSVRSGGRRQSMDSVNSSTSLELMYPFTIEQWLYFVVTDSR